LAAVTALLAFLAFSGSALASSAPTIESESVSGLTEHDATLEAQINPGGLETTYKFQIAQSPACLPPPMGYMPCFHVEVGALPGGSVPGGFGASSVSLDLAGAGMTLQPSTTYSYRVVATNSAGPTVNGPSKTFSTPPTAKPSIESASVSGITEHDATLEAQINTGGAATHYQLHLEYGCGISGEPCAQFCVVPGPCPGPVNGPVDIPLPSGDLPGSSEVEHVSLDLHEVGVTLAPATKYRYSIEATNTAGTAEGPGQIFTTPSSQPAANTPPSIESESVSHVTSTDATLEAQINLHEASAGAYYQFQLVKEPSEYASEILCPAKLPPATDGCAGTQSASALPIGFLPGNTAQPGVDLSAILDLASAGVTLKPGTTYHYRVLVARRVQTEDTIQWEAPTVYGADQTFTTPTPPSIESESISHLTPTDATLEAQINTEGLETTYEFQLFHHLCPPGTEPLGCKAMIEEVPLPSGKLLGSFVSQTVSLNLNSVGVTLYPDTEYDYRVVVTSAAGKAEGSSQTFVTPEDGVQPPSTSTATSSPSGGSQSGTSSTPAGSGGSSSTPGVTPLVSPLQKTVEPKALTKAQKLSKALKQCKKGPKRKRAACEKQAHQKYASVAEKSRKG
jgi:hypothetical protein